MALFGEMSYVDRHAEIEEAWHGPKTTPGIWRPAWARPRRWSPRGAQWRPRPRAADQRSVRRTAGPRRRDGLLRQDDRRRARLLADPERIAGATQAIVDGMAVRTRYFDDTARRRRCRRAAGRHPGVRAGRPRLPAAVAGRRRWSTRSTSRRSSSSRPDAGGYRRQADRDPTHGGHRPARGLAEGVARTGLDTGAPTAWMAEGLLIYLPSEAQDRLFDDITAL